MIISPFTPLFFPDGRKSDGIESPFVQFFSTYDYIRVQVIRTGEEDALPCVMTMLGEYKRLSGVKPSSFELGGGVVVDNYCMRPGLTGFFTVTIGDFVSEPFEITSDSSALERSVLFQYSPADNSVRRDVVPIVNGERIYFSFRVPGGFKSTGYDFSVDNEQFVSQYSDIVELYARESVQETLTVGWGRGVPIWFGQMLNRLLTCRYVYLDGQRYARYESSVPEKSQVLEGVDSFVFTQKLQRINHLEPKKQ